jgi:hypothetical protein
MRELRGRFRGEVAALGEYLDRDLLGLWGYDAGADRRRELGARQSPAPRAPRAIRA